MRNTIPEPERFGLIQRNEDGSNNNALLTTHYTFNCVRIPETSFRCTKANLPGLSLTPTQQATPFNNIARPAGALVADDLKIRFIVDENLKNWLELHDWLQKCSNERDFEKYTEPNEHLESSGTLHINESNNVIRFRIRFNNMFPVSLTGLDFDSSNSASQPMLAEVTFRFTTFDMYSA
jgi:hypothetical protein